MKKLMIAFAGAMALGVSAYAGSTTWFDAAVSGYTTWPVTTALTGGAWNNTDSGSLASTGVVEIDADTESPLQFVATTAKVKGDTANQMEFTSTIEFTPFTAVPAEVVADAKVGVIAVKTTVESVEKLQFYGLAEKAAGGENEWVAIGDPQDAAATTVTVTVNVGTYTDGNVRYRIADGETSLVDVYKTAYFATSSFQYVNYSGYGKVSALSATSEDFVTFTVPAISGASVTVTNAEKVDDGYKAISGADIVITYTAQGDKLFDNGTATGSTTYVYNGTAVSGEIAVPVAEHPTVDSPAKIGTQLYLSFAGAIEAAQSGDTVTLLQNCTTADDDLIGAGITLDLNAKNLTIPADTEFTLAGTLKCNADGFNFINLGQMLLGPSSVVYMGSTLMFGTVDEVAGKFTIAVGGSAVQEANDGDPLKGMKYTLTGEATMQGDFVHYSEDPVVYNLDMFYLENGAVFNATAADKTQAAKCVLAVNSGYAVVENAGVYTASPITYSVTLVAAEGATVTPSTYTVSDAAQSFTLTAPTARAGYTFTDWTATLGTIDGNTLTIPAETIGNITVTANWTKNPVAQIGSTTYATIQAAFDAAVDGQTVQLLEDTAESVLYAGTATFTLDLNGKVWSYTTELDGSNLAALKVWNSSDAAATITIKDTATGGKMYCPGEGFCIWAKTGKVYIQSGKFYNNSNDYYAIYANNVGSVEITGGEFVNENTDPYVYNPELSRLNLNVAQTQPKVGEIVVKGGTFTAEPKDDSGPSFVADGYQATENKETGIWTVSEVVGTTFTVATTGCSVSVKINDTAAAAPYVVKVGESIEFTLTPSSTMEIPSYSGQCGNLVLNNTSFTDGVYTYTVTADTAAEMACQFTMKDAKTASDITPSEIVPADTDPENFADASKNIETLAKDSNGTVQVENTQKIAGWISNRSISGDAIAAVGTSAEGALTATQFEEAYLLDCATLSTEAIATAKAAFKFPSITPGTAPAVAENTYNGTVTVKGADSVAATGDDWHAVTPGSSDSYKFYKAELTK